MKNKRVKKIKASTQKYLDIAEIRNDVVIMKDGSLRAVLLVSSINFALKSEDEQGAIISSYVNFMNSFDFPIQIVIQSRKLNIEAYLNQLREREKTLVNDQLKLLMADYRQFVADLVEMGDIMSKKFYVVVPYSSVSDKRKNFWSRLYDLFSPMSSIKLREQTFQKHRRELMQRVEHVIMNLNSMGLQSVLLDTQSLIELYYEVYNPVISQNQKLGDINKLRIENY